MTRRVPLQLIRNREHLDLVVEAVRSAKISVWIATANLKDVHVEAKIGTVARARGRFTSLFEELEGLARGGVEVRILHASAPSKVLKPKLKVRAIRRACPRVHLKMIAIDGRALYLGSANFTGAGLGAKSDHRRNFEAGILTSDDVLLDVMQSEFDAIWSGLRCKGCLVRAACPSPLDGEGARKTPPRPVQAVDPKPSAAPRKITPKKRPSLPKKNEP